MRNQPARPCCCHEAKRAASACCCVVCALTGTQRLHFRRLWALGSLGAKLRRLHSTCEAFGHTHNPAGLQAAGVCPPGARRSLLKAAVANMDRFPAGAWARALHLAPMFLQCKPSGHLEVSTSLFGCHRRLRMHCRSTGHGLSATKSICFSLPSPRASTSHRPGRRL